MEKEEKKGYGGCLSFLLPLWIVGQIISLVQSIGFAAFFTDLPLIPILLIGSNIVALIGIILLLMFKKIGFYIFILSYFLMVLLGVVYPEIFDYGIVIRSILGLVFFLILMCFKNKDTKLNGYQTLGIFKAKSKVSDNQNNKKEDDKCNISQQEQKDNNEINLEEVHLEEAIPPITETKNNDNYDDDKNQSEPVCEKDEISNTENVVFDKKESRNKEYSSIFKKIKSNKIARIGITLFVFIVILLISISIYISLNTYPKYISSFSDKWRYTFNMSNDELGKEMLNRVYLLKKNTYYIYDVPGYDIDVVDSAHFFNRRDDVYREYPTSKTYIGKTKINDLANLDSRMYYIIVPTSGNPYAYKGSELSSNNDRIVDAFSKTVYETEEYDYEKEAKKEIQLLDELAQIPLSDLKLISEIGSYYETLGVLSKAADFYKFELEHNDNLPEIRGMLAYVLAKNGESTQAREQAEIVLEEEPKDLNALSAMALIEADEYNWKEAKSFAKKAIDYGANDSYVYYAYCEALNKQGEIKASQKYYNLAYETDYWNPRREKYSEYAGCPFEILEFHYCSERDNGTIVIPWDEKLVKKKCYFIGFKLDVNVLRNAKVKVGVKIYENGRLESGINGYTFYDKIGGGHTGKKSFYIDGWGNESGTAWSVGEHRIEIWYKGKKIAEDTFHIY